MHLDKFEGADFNYLSSFCKILAQNYPHEAFLVPNSGILLFHEVSQLDKFQGAKFKYNDILFKFYPKDTQRDIFDLKFNDFYFYAKLNAKTNSRTVASNMTIIFSNSRIQNTEIWHF